MCLMGRRLHCISDRNSSEFSMLSEEDDTEKSFWDSDTGPNTFLFAVNIVFCPKPQSNYR